MGLLARIDRAALANYCLWWGTLVECQRILKREGLTAMTQSGYLQQRPEVAIAQKAAGLCKAFLVEFGLTPASRTRVAVPEQKPVDEFSAFLAAKAVNE